MKDTLAAVSVIVAIAGAILLTVSLAVLGWTSWLAPQLGTGDALGGGLLMGTLGPLWVIGLPLVVAGVAGWWLSRGTRRRA
ncbi:hypothetical protein GKZ75_10320 [Kocuria indica]|uniref:Uncharacterized protein n=1 Tax=Kocuria marina subsp. indica TaxID=1049583 RepID=A0A6N9R222_9MICC|nr:MULTISPECIES: hypothetical protein [Kocuria]MCT1615686.1 hypothetical protein [Kocuria marina]NDO78610.1 hypothetical protein [Kocuria indica]